MDSDLSSRLVVAATKNIVSLRGGPQGPTWQSPAAGQGSFLPLFVPETWRGLPRQCAHWLAMTCLLWGVKLDLEKRKTTWNRM